MKEYFTSSSKLINADNKSNHMMGGSNSPLNTVHTSVNSNKYNQMGGDYYYNEYKKFKMKYRALKNQR